MTENNTAYFTMGIAQIINRQPSIADHHQVCQGRGRRIY